MLSYCHDSTTERSTRWSPSINSGTVTAVLHVAVRVVLDLKPRDHISSALRELHWLPVSEQVVYNLCFLIHKESVGQSPDYIIDLLQPVAATLSLSSLRDASRGHYVVPRTNREMVDRAFYTDAPRAWNQLPTELKRTKSTSAFRQGLKMFLFTRACNSE